MTFFGPPNIAKLEKKRKIDALIKALAYPDKPDIRSEAATALGRLKAQSSVDALISAIDDDHPTVRHAAAKALATIGDTSAAQPLIGALEKAPPTDRALFLKALVVLGDPKAVPAFIQVRDQDAQNRRIAIKGLIRFSAPAVLDPVTQKDHPLHDLTLDMLKTAQPNIVLLIAAALGDHHNNRDLAQLLIQFGEPAVAPLIALLGPDQAHFNQILYECLAKIGTSAAAQALMAALTATDMEERAAAILGVAQAGHPKAARVIRKGLLDPVTDVQEAALEAAAIIADESLLDAVSPFLKGMGEPLGYKAITVLEQTGGKKAARMLAKALKRTYFKHRSEAARALSGFQIKGLGKFFSGLVHDGDHQVKKIAIGALTDLDARQAVPILENALQDKDLDIRQTAAQTLEAMGQRPASNEGLAWFYAALRKWEALDQLKDVAQKPLIALLHTPYTFQQAARLLQKRRWTPHCAHPKAVSYWMETGQIQACVNASKAAVPYLINYLADSTGRRCQNAACALGKIGDPTAVSALCDRLNTLQEGNYDQAPANRAAGVAIVRALGDIGDSKSLKYLSALVDATPISKSWVMYHANVKKAAVDALAKSGTGSVEHLTAVLSSEKFDLRFQAQCALDRLLESKTQDVVPELIAALHHPKMATRKFAAKKLVSLYDGAKVDERARKLIFKVKDIIAAPHTDQGHDRPHDDGIRTVEGWCKKHVDTPGTSHADMGIGVNFPDQDPLFGRIEVPLPASAAPVADLIGKLDLKQAEGVRAEAIVRLAGYDVSEARQAVIAALTDKAWPVRAAAARALKTANIQTATAYLLPCLTDTAWQVRQDALRSLEALKYSPEDPSNQQLMLQAALESMDPVIRCKAAADLGALRLLESVDALIEALNDPESTVRQAVATALGHLGRPKGRESLIKALSDPDTAVCKAAAKALKQLGGPLGLLGDPLTRYHIVLGDWQACAKLGDAALAALAETMQENDLQIGLAAAQTLAAMPSPLTLRYLTAALKDNPHAPIRAVMAHTLGKRGQGLGPVRDLTTALEQDPAPEVRQAAAAALGAIKPDVEQKVLEKAEKTDPDVSVCRAAITALKNRRIDQTGDILLDIFLSSLNFREEIDKIDLWGTVRPSDVPEIGSSHLAGLKAGSWEKLGENFGEKRKAVVQTIGREIDRLQGGITDIYRFHGADGLAALEKAVKNPKNDRGLAAIGILAKLSGQASLEIVAKAIRYDRLRKPAEEILMQKAATVSAEWMARLLAPRETDSVRQSAAKVLAALDWHPQTISQQVALAIVDKKWNDCLVAGQEAATPLSQALESQGLTEDQLNGVANTLARLGGPQAAKALEQGIHNNFYPARLACLKSLSLLDGPQALQIILPILKNPLADAQKRAFALKAMKTIYPGAPDTFKAQIRTLAQSALKHTDVASVYHQDTRTRQPGHSDYGGGKCIYAHHDVGSIHHDVPSRPHQDCGLSSDFPL
jgi:HEAT repeat protein